MTQPGNAKGVPVLQTPGTRSGFTRPTKLWIG